MRRSRSTRGATAVLPSARAAENKGRVSHSLRNATERSTVPAARKSARSRSRSTIAAPKRARSSAGRASRECTTRSRKVRLASRGSAGSGAAPSVIRPGWYPPPYGVSRLKLIMIPFSVLAFLQMKHAHHHHRERRARLIAEMRSQTGGGLAAIPTAPQAIRNADTHYPYRPDSHFYYLSGFPEPEAVVLLIAGVESGDSRQVLFCRDKNPEREIWDGFRYGPEAAREIFGFDEAYSISELPARLVDWTCDRPALYTPLGLHAEWDHAITAALNEVRNRVRTGIAAPETVIDVRGGIAAMRLIKDAEELKLMRRAAEISSLAHRRAMARTEPGWYEYQAEAELAHEFLRFGAQIG